MSIYHIPHFLYKPWNTNFSSISVLLGLHVIGIKGIHVKLHESQGFYGGLMFFSFRFFWKHCFFAFRFSLSSFPMYCFHFLIIFDLHHDVNSISLICYLLFRYLFISHLLRGISHFLRISHFFKFCSFFQFDRFLLLWLLAHILHFSAHVSFVHAGAGVVGC